MKAAALFDEFARAAGATDRRHFDWLETRGVPRDFLFCGPARFGVGEIAFGDHGLYQPQADGIEAIIMPAIPLLALWDERWRDGDDDLGDLIAWSPTEPTRWWRRCRSEPVLNPDAIGAARWRRQPLRVWSSPLAWLVSGGTGIVLLGSDLHLPLYLGGIGAVIADTLELGEQIQRQLRVAPIRLPHILVREEAVAE